MNRTIHLIVVLSLVGCSSSSHLTINSVVEDYLESYATGPVCLTSDPWWCDGKWEPPDTIELKPCAQLVIVRQTTNSNLGTGSHTEWPKDAVADLWRQREESSELMVKHAAHLPVVLIDEDEVQALDPCTYFDLFPGAPKVLEFSNVGFSSDGKSAVFVSTTLGYPGGTTGILANWSDGRWSVVDHEAIELY
jgi:hypothetical protein